VRHGEVSIDVLVADACQVGPEMVLLDLGSSYPACRGPDPSIAL